MKTLAYVLVLALVVPALARAEEAWRWTDDHGTVHYTNRPDAAPAAAARVTTRLIVDASRLPDEGGDLVLRDGAVLDAADTGRDVEAKEQRPHRIYGEERLRFGCMAGQTLFAGGWAHPGDISVQGGCLPYLLGPEAWLNAARAELSLREHGIHWREIVPLYLAERRWREAFEKHLTAAD
jgi:hypothetical protein